LRTWLGTGLLGVLALGAVVGLGMAEPVEVWLAMRNNRFVPEEIRVKAGTAFTLVVTNEDRVRREFEVEALGIERVIRPGATARVTMPPLKAGTYAIIDDDGHPPIKGRLVAE
jgi:hypothetical protein